MVEVTETQKTLGWARVYATVRRDRSKALRRGAWYAVVQDTHPDRVSILLYGRPVQVPRRILEIRKDKPKFFSVVNRVDYDEDARRKSQYNLGKRYGVCPECTKRFGLWAKSETVTCPECKHTGPVAWWED